MNDSQEWEAPSLNAGARQVFAPAIIGLIYFLPLTWLFFLVDRLRRALSDREIAFVINDGGLCLITFLFFSFLLIFSLTKGIFSWGCND